MYLRKNIQEPNRLNNLKTADTTPTQKTQPEETYKSGPKSATTNDNTSNEVNDIEYQSYIHNQKLKKERDYDDFVDSMYKHAKLKEEI